MLEEACATRQSYHTPEFYPLSAEIRQNNLTLLFVHRHTSSDLGKGKLLSYQTLVAHNLGRLFKQEKDVTRLVNIIIEMKIKTLPGILFSRNKVRFIFIETHSFHH